METTITPIPITRNTKSSLLVKLYQLSRIEVCHFFQIL